MSLSKVTSVENTTESIELDSSKLMEGHTYTKVCLLIKIASKLDIYERGMLNFYVKDVNNHVVRCTLFDVKDFYTSGINSSMMLNRPVIVKFTAQVFMGQWSLIIDHAEGIKPYDGEFDREKFIGRIPCDVQQLSWLPSKVEMDIDIEAYAISSLAQICNGKIGGFFKLFEACISNLIGYNQMPGISSIDVLKVFTASMEVYFRFLREQQGIEIITNTLIFDKIQMANAVYADSSLRIQIIDTLKGLLDLQKPETLYGNMICDLVKMVKHNFDMIYVYDQMILGAKANVGGAELLKI